MQMQQEINQLRSMNLAHPKVNEVINSIRANQNYQTMNKMNLNLLFLSEMSKRFPAYYQNEIYFRQTLNEIFDLIDKNNIFNQQPNFHQNLNLNFQGNQNDRNFGIYDDKKNERKIKDSNFDIYDYKNKKKEGNFDIYDDKNKHKEGNFDIYDDNKNRNNDGNFGIYDDKNKHKEGNFDIYDDNKNKNKEGNFET